MGSWRNSHKEGRGDGQKEEVDIKRWDMIGTEFPRQEYCGECGSGSVADVAGRSISRKEGPQQRQPRAQGCGQQQPGDDYHKHGGENGADGDTVT